MLVSQRQHEQQFRLDVHVHGKLDAQVSICGSNSHSDDVRISDGRDAGLRMGGQTRQFGTVAAPTPLYITTISVLPLSKFICESSCSEGLVDCSYCDLD